MASPGRDPPAAEEQACSGVTAWTRRAESRACFGFYARRHAPDTGGGRAEFLPHAVGQRAAGSASRGQVTVCAGAGHGPRRPACSLCRACSARGLGGRPAPHGRADGTLGGKGSGRCLPEASLCPGRGRSHCMEGTCSPALGLVLGRHGPPHPPSGPRAQILVNSLWTPPLWLDLCPH